MDREPLERAEVAADRIMKTVEANIPKGWGVVVCLFSYSDKEPQQKGFATYLSNINRKDIPSALRDLAGKVEIQNDA